MDLDLTEIVAAAKAQFGEAEYAYSKTHITWVHGRKRNEKGSHFRPIDRNIPVIKEEYEANIAESKRISVEAFMGRYCRSYWDYDRKLTKPGWREKLVEIIQSLPDSASEPHT